MKDSDAVALSENIQKYHLPHGFIAETIFKDDGSIGGIAGYGDCAIWTGAYLAAESFRYAVTKRESADGMGDSDAKKNLDAALKSVQKLAFVAESGFLARGMFPNESPYRDQLVADEKHSGLFKVIIDGELWYWIGHHTRDQYAGALFGLGTAHDLVNDDAEVRNACAKTITHLVDALIAHNWTMYNPGGNQRFKESFGVRPDHMLGVLQLAQHVNARFTGQYEVTCRELSLFAGIPQWTDFFHLRDAHYSMMHLGYLYFYQLIRYEKRPKIKNRYLECFKTLRDKTGGHFNAHFNMIDHALTGPHADRDRQTIGLLESLFKRGFRNVAVDVTAKYPRCGEDACEPIPVEDRPYEDFLWQRHPYSMSGGSDGRKESPGLDFILPYWMARYYKLLDGK